MSEKKQKKPGMFRRISAYVRAGSTNDLLAPAPASTLCTLNEFEKLSMVEDSNSHTHFVSEDMGSAGGAGGGGGSRSMGFSIGDRMRMRRAQSVCNNEMKKMKAREENAITDVLKCVDGPTLGIKAHKITSDLISGDEALANAALAEAQRITGLMCDEYLESFCSAISGGPMDGPDVKHYFLWTNTFLRSRQENVFVFGLSCLSKFAMMTPRQYEPLCDFSRFPHFISLGIRGHCSPDVATQAIDILVGARGNEARVLNDPIFAGTVSGITKILRDVFEASNVGILVVLDKLLSSFATDNIPVFDSETVSLVCQILADTPELVERMAIVLRRLFRRPENTNLFCVCLSSLKLLPDGREVREWQQVILLAGQSCERGHARKALKSIARTLRNHQRVLNESASGLSEDTMLLFSESEDEAADLLQQKPRKRTSSARRHTSIS